MIFQNFGNSKSNDFSKLIESINNAINDILEHIKSKRPELIASYKQAIDEISLPINIEISPKHTEILIDRGFSGEQLKLKINRFREIYDFWKKFKEEYLEEILDLILNILSSLSPFPGIEPLRELLGILKIDYILGEKI